jgi:hypothetical protein
MGTQPKDSSAGFGSLEYSVGKVDGWLASLFHKILVERYARKQIKSYSMAREMWWKRLLLWILLT